MTPEAQRICIAEACGWGGCYAAHGMLLGDPQPGKGIGVEQLPDYLNDLNACHEMEKVLVGESQQREYIRQLWMLDDMSKYRDSPQWSYWPMLHASAAQRAEAFLRCLGKWDDTL